MKEVAGILLAADSARRFGRPKLLNPLHDGAPIALAAAHPLMQVLPNTVALVTPDHQALTEVFSAIG